MLESRGRRFVAARAASAARDRRMPQAGRAAIRPRRSRSCATRPIRWPKRLLSPTESRQRLAPARLHVLLDGGSSEGSFLRRVKSLIAVGVPIIQLRDKKLSDRKMLARGRLLRQVIDESGSGALFIMNDRADLAALTRADGLHIGQDELIDQRRPADHWFVRVDRRFDSQYRPGPAGGAGRRELHRLRPRFPVKHQGF